MINYNKHKLDVDYKLVWGNSKTLRKPYLSFFIPTYNRTTTLYEAIDSVLKQPLEDEDYEILIVNNGQDKEVNKNILEHIKSLDNDHILFYQNKVTIPVGENFNRGILISHGTWVSMLHDDDLLSPNYYVKMKKYIKYALKKCKQVGYIKVRPMHFTKTKEFFRSFEKDESTQRFFSKNNKLRKCNVIATMILGRSPTEVPSCGSLINREVAVRFGGFEESYDPYGDGWLGLNIMKEYSIYETNDFLGGYRDGNGQTANKDIVCGLIKQEIEFRKEIYRTNLFTRLYGRIFCDIHRARIYNENRELAHANGGSMDDYLLIEKQLFEKQPFRRILDKKMVKSCHKIRLFCSRFQKID